MLAKGFDVDDVGSRVQARRTLWRVPIFCLMRRGGTAKQWLVYALEWVR